MPNTLPFLGLLTLACCCSTAQTSTTGSETSTGGATSGPATVTTGAPPSTDPGMSGSSSTSIGAETTSTSSSGPDASTGTTSAGSGPLTSGSTSVAEGTSSSTGQDSTSIGASTVGDSSSGSSGSSGGLSPLCGDGLLDEGEECDDGPMNADNATCTPACLFAICGDGLVLLDAEECDDGNLSNADLCLDTCKAAKCGDTYVFAGVEECDDGNADDFDACSNSCLAATCSDGILNGQEVALDCGGPDCKPCSVPGLVINEVDYDNVDADAAEFIEVLNTTAMPLSLVGHQVVFVNGANGLVYRTIKLDSAGTINPGQFLVIAHAAFVVPGGALKVNFPAATNQIENGSPDGLALIDTGAKVVLDALSYEGSIEAATIMGFPGPVNLVEGTALAPQVADSNAENGALARQPNGYDGNNAATDWVFVKVPTPGGPNL